MFKNSPTIFDEALHQDLSLFRDQHPEVTLLQYVDDLLLAGETEEECHDGTIALLQELARLGFKASTNLQTGGKIFGLHPKTRKKVAN